jgi:hypothetical protein
MQKSKHRDANTYWQSSKGMYRHHHGGHRRQADQQQTSNRE